MSNNRHPRLVLASLCGLCALLLACAGTAPVARSPRWACPSPTPLPYGESGPVKRTWQECETNPVTGEQRCTEHTEYYEQWEQEYGAGGSLLDGQPAVDNPPFPSPTPYSLTGTSYTLGQRIEVWPLYVMVTARSGALVPDDPASQLYWLDITWQNPTAEAIAMDYGANVRIRAITTAAQAIVTSDRWGLSDRSQRLAQTAPLPSSIPPGESTVSVPIVAPAGAVQTAEITLLGAPDATSTATALAVTPTPNAELRNSSPTYLTVQWSATQLDIGPACGDPGAMTPWDGTGGWGHPAEVALAAPAGASRVVQIALNQLGKTYVWGAKGPETFDCSGLMTWSYAQIGVPIPNGTANQWPNMRPVSQGELEPGDLIFFTVEQPGRIDHVGMLIGDQDGDGTWDMVHASAPCCGVRVEYDVLHRAYWTSKIAGFRTAR